MSDGFGYHISDADDNQQFGIDEAHYDEQRRPGKKRT